MAPSIIYLPKWKSIYHPWGSAKASTQTLSYFEMNPSLDMKRLDAIYKSKILHL